jgi:hypothetical protein
MISILQSMHRITKNARKHFDLIHSINAAIEASPLIWDFQHLDGHQDDHKEFEELDRWAQLNVMVNKATKQELSQIIRSKSSKGSNIHISYVTCTVSHKGTNGTYKPISSHLAKTSLHNIQQVNIREYWKGKKHFDTDTMKLIDWNTLRKSASSYYRIKWLSKFVTGICGVGYMLKLWKHQSHSTCPRCGSENKNVEHVLQCPEQSATQVWEKAVEDLNTCMTDNNLDPGMQKAIIERIKAWRTSHQVEHGPMDFIVAKAVKEQERIGWNNMFHGFITTQWEGIQRQHIKDIDSTKSPILWISKFQKRIWLIPWELWQYRNGFLHNDGATIHFLETNTINQQITAEYDLGIGQLPQNYSHLFQKPVAQLMQQPIFTRKGWLISVWVARDHHTPQHGQICGEIAVSIYNRWKKQIQK